MRKLGLVLSSFVLSSIILCSTSLICQQGAAHAAPQTARQALTEMFFSKTPGTFLKHLPAATRNTLEKSGALNALEQYSLMARQLQTQGKSLETFDTGSVLVSTEDPKTGQKVEVTVENDALRGDEDDIELSFQTYKNGQPQKAPFMPRVTFGMKMESGMWKLNEIAVTIRLPLADPDFLKGISEAMKGQAAALRTTSTGQITPRTDATVQVAGDDTAVIAAMRSILTAEVTYAVTYPSAGFACTLSYLDGFGGAERNEHQAMLIHSGLASGKRYGYLFSISDCAGAPATTFHLTAVPNGNSYGRRAFCADQSNVIRYSTDGNAATCLSSGTPVQ
jgi:hypothetical protein